MTVVEVIADLKQLFDNITSCLDDVKKEVWYLWWLPIIVKFFWYYSHTIGGVMKERAGRLSSYLGLINNELQEILEIYRGGKLQVLETQVLHAHPDSQRG